MYKKRFNLIEPTKLLERVTVDNLRFLNPLGHDYVNGAVFIFPERTGRPPIGSHETFATYYGSESGSPPSAGNLNGKLYKSIYAANVKLDIYELCYWAGVDGGGFISLPTDIKVIAPDSKEIWLGTSSATTGNIIGQVQLKQVGKYVVEYIDGKLVNTYTFYVVDEVVSKKPYTITEVINRVLNAGVGAHNGYYKLDPKFAELWKDVEAPEFEITGKTLFEALLMIGGYKDIQAIPRLMPTPGSEEDWEYNFITFDVLNGDEEWTPPSDYIDRQEYWDGESYCGGVESYVDNFVDNSKNGSVKTVLPMTVRTDSGDLVIDDGHAIIKTEFPLYTVQQVWQAYINATGGVVGDITPYIFERSEYDKLTSYVGIYPMAKQFALYYVQGQPNVYGLVLKPETATSIGLALQDMAAVQIAERKSGQKFETTLGVASCAYKVTYTPITSRRIRQFRPTRDFPNGNMLYYNQSANVVDAKNYGGRMKSELARIGNKVELETYRIYKFADMPRAGMKKDGMYISQVDWEMDIVSIKVTIHLVKNYNRINEYVGINSMQRYYEVSERQATDRKCNFSYFAQVGRLIGSKNTKKLLTSDGIRYFADSFNNKYPAGEIKVSYVVVTAYAKDGTQIQSPTVHSVCGNGIGNSMSFYFQFEDNYSAGGQALYNNTAKKVQRAVPYADEYGELYSLKMDFYGAYATKDDLTFADQVSLPGMPAWCDLLPQVAKAPSNNPPLMSYEVVIDKNGGEKISVETQIHFQFNDPNIIIGTALGEDNLLVSNEQHTHSFVCLPYEIEQLQERIPVEDVEAWKITSPDVKVVTEDGEIAGVTFGSVLKPIRNTTSADALSWACVNELGNILIAKNQTIKKGEATYDLPIINFNLTID